MATRHAIVLMLTAGLVIAAASAPIPGNAQTVAPASRVVLQVGGRTVGVFGQVSGLNAAIESPEFGYIAPSGNGSHPKQFGKTKPPSITLKRSLSATKALRAWHQQVRAGSPAARKNATLLLENKTGQVLMRYKLLNAWPSKISIEEMKAGSSATAAETVTILCERVVLEQGAGGPAPQR